VSDIDTEVVDSLKALDPDGRLEKQTFALQLFDHLVGEREPLIRHVEGERGQFPSRWERLRRGAVSYVHGEAARTIMTEKLGLSLVPTN
jgi:hypothetical protein